MAVQGVLPKDTRFTCTACAGTLLLEFGTLSRLTGDPIYEQKASHAVKQVFGASLPSLAWLSYDYIDNMITWCRSMQLLLSTTCLSFLNALFHNMACRYA